MTHYGHPDRDRARRPEVLDLVFDVETVGPPFSSLSLPMQAYLTDRAYRRLLREGHDQDAAAKLCASTAEDQLALMPGLARVVAIGICEVATGATAVVVDESGDATSSEAGEEPAVRVAADEAALLEVFWRWVGGRKRRRLVSFNGRGFDAPVLHARSSVLSVAPTRNLSPYRYDFSEVCDLAEVFSLMGSTRDNFTLAYWCEVMGVESPKAEMTGAGVALAYREGRTADIASYVAADVRATRELYLRVAPTAALFKGGPHAELESDIVELLQARALREVEEAMYHEVARQAAAGEHPDEPGPDEPEPQADPQLDLVSQDGAA